MGWDIGGDQTQEEELHDGPKQCGNEIREAEAVVEAVVR